GVWSAEQQALVGRLVEGGDWPALEGLVGRFLKALDWAGLLEGIGEPAGQKADPDYLEPFEFDPQPMPPSIDEYARVRKLSGAPAIIHIRMQRLYQDNIGAVLHREAERLRAEHHCEVQTAVMLLWEGADGPAMTGEYTLPGGEVFRYHLTRMWERDVDEMFNSVGTVA